MFPLYLQQQLNVNSTVESGTPVKSVKITLNILAVYLDLIYELRPQ